MAIILDTINASAPLLKILQMRLPDPILRKAPETSSAMLQSRKFQQEKFGERMSENGWFFSQNWPTSYAEITTEFNVQNRLASDLQKGHEPAHEDVINTRDVSSALYSLCKEESYDADCGGKTPVVFIYGYAMADLNLEPVNII